MKRVPAPTTALAPLPVLEMLHDQLPHGVAILDADLRLVYANPCWRALISGTRSVPGTTLTSLFPDAGDLHAAAARSVSHGEPVHIPEHPFGETVQDITFAPLTVEGAVIGLKCVMHDATARVFGKRSAAAQERLVAFRLDISRALASSGEPGAVLQACAEAMVRHADAAFARIWVLEEAEDIYRLRASAGMYTRLNGTYSRIPAEWIRQKIFGGHSAQVALDILKTHNVRDPEWAAANGLVAWANHPLMVSGRIVGFMSIFARQNFSPDILDELGAISDAIAQFLERAHAESAMREREMLFRSVFESAADGLLISDLQTGRIVEANPVVCAMYGCSHEEICQMDRAELVHPESHAKLADYLTAIREGRPARVQVTGVRKDGTTFPASAQGSPILYEGKPAVLGIIRDVTREQEAQEELERRVAERTRELSFLLESARNVASTLELTPLLELILEQLGTVIAYTGTAILTIDGDDLVISGQRGPLPEEIARRIRYPITTMTAVWARLEQGEAIVIPDVRASTPEATAFRAGVSSALEEHLAFIGSCLWAPLLVRDELIGIMSITSGETGAFDPGQVQLATAVARQAAVAIANARLFDQARGMAALEERQRLARELHDSVSQALFGISLGAETAKTMLVRDPERTAAAIDYVLQLARGGMAEMRALIFELRPESLEQEGLVAALEKQAAAAGARHGIEVDLALPAEPELPIAIKEALYRVAQEAMHNTARHAEASRILLRLDDRGDPLTMDIIDDGCGFDPAAEFPGHLGLVSMRERVARFGGEIEIASRPGEGTRVRVTLPRPSDNGRRGDHAGSRTAG